MAYLSFESLSLNIIMYYNFILHNEHTVITPQFNLHCKQRFIKCVLTLKNLSTWKSLSTCEFRTFFTFSFIIFNINVFTCCCMFSAGHGIFRIYPFFVVARTFQINKYRTDWSILIQSSIPLTHFVAHFFHQMNRE